MDKDALKEKAIAYLDWSDDLTNRPKPKKAPFAPIGERVLIRQRPPETMSRIIHIPQSAQERPEEGILIAAGDDAADMLFDHGIDQNDHIFYGRHAGLLEEWSHEIAEGESHDHDWTICPVEIERARAWSCDCGAIKVTEPMVVMNRKDVLGSVDLQVRLETGQTLRRIAHAENGATRFVTERQYQDPPRTWNIENVLKNPRKVA